MKNLDEVKNNFDKNLEMVSQLVNIGVDIGNLTVSFLKNLETQYEKMPAFVEYKRKLAIVIEQIEKIKDAPQLKEKYEVIRNQTIVLLVENFESFMNDCVKVLVNHYPEVIDWPEKKKTLPVNVDVLRYSAPTVGDLVITSLKGEINFQDLQSTLRFLKEYLNIDLNEINQDSIIFAQALRNIVVHNSSFVDHSFLSQIKNTKYNGQFRDKDKVTLNESEFNNIFDSFNKFSKSIIKELKNKTSEK